MTAQHAKKGYLILANGQVFQGWRRGDTEKTPMAELVFTTGMTGCLEALTDPSFYGHMVVHTFPLIGNCGVIPQDFESPAPALSGYIVSQLCSVPSNFRSQGPLDVWLKQAGVPVLEGVDTRQITRIVRQSGVMNAILSDTPALTDAQWQALKAHKTTNAIAAVTCKATHTAQPENAPPASQPPRKVVLFDFGAKASIAKSLLQRGCTVVTVPAATPVAEALAHKPDGILFSSGPGDPAENTTIIRNVAQLLKSGVPLFGIDMGHHLMALAHGARTRKMKFGHRGSQPALNTETGRACLTSQNHGYCVVGESLGATATELYKNANDGTCEGVRYHQFPGFSVQFHPEGASGPLDTTFLFDEFIQMMNEVNINA